jgi:hypothetical protein
VLNHDPVEETPAYRAVVAQVEAEAALDAAGYVRTDGWCHFFWEAKQRLLCERHGNAWRTPAEMNPRVSFD